MRFSLFMMLVAAPALAQVSYDGEVVVVQDNGAITNLVTSMTPVIFPSPQEQFCREAFNTARAAGLQDEFDGVITFTTSEAITDLQNVWQGSPVRSDGSGYGRTNSPHAGTYDSTKISQCVFMGTLGRTASFFPGGAPGPEALPANPDSPWRPSLGVPISIDSLTGIEMLGHEYGHHWLLGIEFNQNDGRGNQHFIRGFNADTENGGGYANQHYSHWADSRSVMYGSCITDKGGGEFELKGCPRKYSHIDQYLMGLRAADEVEPMMVLEDPADQGRGVDSIAMGASASGMTVQATRHDITADEIIAAMGSRVPGYPHARNCWRVAFIVVLAPGQTTIPNAMRNKVHTYRSYWGEWFNFATDGRGSMDTRLQGNGCVSFGEDAGVPEQPFDAGVEPPADAGSEAPPDAGAEEEEEEEEDAGVPEETDGGDTTGTGGGTGGAGGQSGDAGTEEDDSTRFLKNGCGCTSGVELFAIMSALLLIGRRRNFAR